MHSEVYCRLYFHLNSIFKTSIIYKTIKNLQSNHAFNFITIMTINAEVFEGVYSYNWEQVFASFVSSRYILYIQ